MYSQHAQEGGQLSSLLTCCSTLHLSAAQRLDKQTWTVAMSESIVKKIQPFTIGTKLSVPAVPKCQEFTETYLQSQNLDNCTLQQDLNSLYLSRQQVCAHGTCQGSQTGQQVALVKHKREDTATEDNLNQNAAASSAVSRSIKKITISGNNKSPENTISVGLRQRSILGSTSKNHNNNNNISGTPVPNLPRIVGVNCENKPKSHFKVLVKTHNGEDYPAQQGPTKSKLNVQKYVQQEKKAQRHQHHTQNDESADVLSLSDCYIQNKDDLQAETWNNSKVQELKDDCKIQRCPLQDWDEASQILQRDLKDFDNTLIQLNQTGDHLICKLNPTSDLVKNQLSHFKDQWNILKQTAASQSRVLGCSKNLQEFNRKVDKLEIWIKEKEEEQYLVNVLGANVDKMQLTRRILDLKQDEQLYRTLHEEINQMALKLEKQGKSDSKSISSRRKNINKMWLKVQSHLKKHQDNLHIALEVSSFYQQADNTLFAINNMMKSISSSKEPGLFGDREIRDIASQIMMLDVSVSQLSNLHPALAAGVTQKQSEVRDLWVSLQKVFRSDRTALLPMGSTFTREDADPSTSQLQCSMGKEIQTTMGKQSTEWQSHDVDYLSTYECCGSAKQSQALQCVNHTSSPMGDGPDDVIISHQSRRERKPRGEPKRANALKGHPQLPIQLQKFTVSADKTLSWLKENVSMATQVCSITTFEGLEAARMCQNAVQQEILANKARVEVVKREGHGLIRAQHPGSNKIGQFLSQLEALWDELQIRHQSNAVFLQASEDIGFRVVKVLHALGILEAWLESVELSMKDSSLAASDPKTKSIGERESSQLENEVATRGLELIALRQEVARLHGHSHPHTRSLPSRIEEVDRKYQCVLRTLAQKSSKMQDTHMLTENLESVALEDSQGRDSGQYCFNQPIHSMSSSIPDLLGLESSQLSMCDPVDELREAMEMLNDKARERRKSQGHEESIQELLSKQARLSACIEECLCGYNKLNLDILEKETEMAVQCEPDHCNFETLQKREAHLEIDYEVLTDEVKEMEGLASRLKELCPERMHVLWPKTEGTLQVWAELEKSVMQIKSRLQEFLNLQDFFRSYLAMISWTEETRLCVFSDTMHQEEDGPQSTEIDIQIEQKLEEFDTLAASGRNILDKEHHLTQMVAERMEELQNMLGWISVHWKVKKQEWLHKKSRQEPSIDNIYTEATLYCPSETTDSYEFCQSQNILSEASKAKPGGDSQTSEQFLGHAQQPKEKQLEDGYEVMKSIRQRDCESVRSESSTPSLKLIKEPSSPSLGGMVNLILSIGNSGESQLQVVNQTVGNDVLDQTSESFHRPTVPACKNFWKRCQGLLENTLGSLKRKKKIYRQSANEVSTYLHIKDNSSTVAPVYESITPPRQKSRLTSSACPSSSTTSSSPSSTGQAPLTGVSFHPLNGIMNVNGSIFSSLKRMGKKRKRKRDTRRHTIQKVMGVDSETDEPLYACETVTYDTRTWPLKEGRRKKKLPQCGEGVDTVVDQPNPLLKDIELECTQEDAITPYAVSERPNTSIQGRGQHRLLSLGSVLSFDLPKDITLIPKIQEIITIAPRESNKTTGTDPDPNFQRHTALSSFKQSRLSLGNAASRTENNSKTQSSTVFVKDLPDNDRNSNTSPAPENDEDQMVPCNDLCTRQFNLQNDAEQDWDEMSSGHKTANDDSRKISQAPIYVNQATVSTTAAHKHQCPNIHTLIRDLNGHKYHKSGMMQGENDEKQSLHQASHKVVNLKSTVNLRQDSVDSGISSSSSIKLCSEASCPDNPQITGMVGKLMSLHVGRIDCIKVTDNEGASKTSKDSQQEPVQLNHQQFEEEEEELEGIWNKTPNFRQSISSDIMYQPNQEESTSSDHSGDPVSTSSPNKGPAIRYRNLATVSEPNLFVADFRLPFNILEQSPQSPLQTIRDRRSWAALPNRDQLGRTLMGVNETAADQLRLPDVVDNHKYIYQYRQEEEDEEDSKSGEKIDEHTACSKYQSDDFCCTKKDARKPETLDMQEALTATSGHCGTMDGNLELQSMEGTLERKQKLQLGGKKAASRGWNSYQTVLYRHTLCFYQDRKETLRSSACGLPLNLTGAECLSAPEYTKKPNCFRLRLRDGSEYLFNASSRIMMNKWMSKIQANIGASQSLLSSSTVEHSIPIFVSPPLCSGCHGLTKCYCSSQHDATSTFPRRKPPNRSEEMLVPSREFTRLSQSHLRCLEEGLTMSSTYGHSCSGDDCSSSCKQVVTDRFQEPIGENTTVSHWSSPCSNPDRMSSKPRSHSFTSATYQRIKPTQQTSGGPEKASNYSVTLVLGDKLSDSKTYDAPSVTVAGWQKDACSSTSCNSPSPPRSKSVFMKFFGKKDL
ncbi:uncharacterized protein LOC130923451 isoform X2 [Corythoichthys intestinalis]|uniref:uncharacterized protein LOC130923451 isoform X2 n=1 Tax=Corythoichthys intestinalis TaxID=161448 RepID=UPI0025A58776|nr:uncharacterized protein LOC130923451 isoform X2 [Corythoichthys intestinalis]